MGTLEMTAIDGKMTGMENKMVAVEGQVNLINAAQSKMTSKLDDVLTFLSYRTTSS